MLKLVLLHPLPLAAAGSAAKTVHTASLPEELGLLFLLAAVVLVLMRARSILELLERGHDHHKPKVLNWPTALRSVSGGLAAAYVLLLLVPEFSTINAELDGQQLSSYELALLGLLIFKGIQHFCLQRANASYAAMGEWKFVGVKTAEKRSNFAINLGVFTGYAALIFLTLPFQFSHLSGWIASTLYVITFALHLGFDALAVCEEDKQRFSRLAPRLVLPVLVITSLVAAFGPAPESVFLTAFSLLGGIVIYNVFRVELRKPENTSFIWFVGGAILFSLLNSLKLQAGGH